MRERERERICLTVLVARPERKFEKFPRRATAGAGYYGRCCDLLLLDQARKCTCVRGGMRSIISRNYRIRAAKVDNRR